MTNPFRAKPREVLPAFCGFVTCARRWSRFWRGNSFKGQLLKTRLCDLDMYLVEPF